MFAGIDRAWNFVVEAVTQFMEGIIGVFIVQPPREGRVIITNINIPDGLDEIVRKSIMGVMKKQIAEAKDMSFPPTLGGEYRRSGLFDFGQKNEVSPPVLSGENCIQFESKSCDHCGTTGKDSRGNCAGCGATR